MKRAVLCVDNPQDYIDQLTDYSLMIIDPKATAQRQSYLLDQADWSLLITDQGKSVRAGRDYPGERLLWYTSGTTGDSKFCSFTQDQIDILAKTIGDAYGITANDRYVSVMSLSHAHGQGFYWAAKAAGCDMQFLPLNEIRNLAKFSPTFITAIPGILKIVGNLDLTTLRFIRSASAALPDSLYQHLRAKFNVPVIEAFGMTESLSHCFTNPLHGQQRMGTVGLPSGIQAEIRDQHLWIKGECLFTKDWYDTGDLAQQDSAGYYRIIGRHRDQININGYKLNPLSIENQLMRLLPSIENCVIFGRESVRCLYVGGCTPTQIQKVLSDINQHCRPSLIKQVDTIPTGIGGKISRNWLEEQYQ
jgi:long-chain acyl-CoA synthetase